LTYLFSLLTEKKFGRKKKNNFSMVNVDVVVVAVA
jgi:hypothetical protein